MAVEGFFRKPPKLGTQLVKLPTFKDPQPVVEEITSSDKEAKTESEKAEDSTSKENTKSPVRDEDFEVFYHLDETKKEASNSQLATTLVSENQEATKVPETVVIEKRLPALLSLLESYVGTTIPEVLIVPRPSMPIPPPPPQTELVERKMKKEQKRRKRLYRGRRSP